MTTIFNNEDVFPLSTNTIYEGKYLIFKPDRLKEEYRSAKYQLFYGGGGFGCYPDKIGTAVFGFFCADGERARFSRGDFLGVATDEAIEDWKKLYGEFVLPRD